MKFWGQGLYISGLKVIRSYNSTWYNSACLFLLGHKHKLSILSHLSDFVTCSAHFNIQSEEYISQLLNTVGRQNLVSMFTRHK